MGGVLCLKFADFTVLDAQDVTGGAVFLRFGSPGVPEVQGVMGGAVCLEFVDLTVLDAQGVMGGAVFLRFGSPGVPEVQGVKFGAVFLRFRASSGSRSDVRRPDQVPWLAGSAY